MIFVNLDFVIKKISHFGWFKPFFFQFVRSYLVRGYFSTFKVNERSNLTIIHVRGAICQYIHSFSLSVARPNLRRGIKKLPIKRIQGVK